MQIEDYGLSYFFLDSVEPIRIVESNLDSLAQKLSLHTSGFVTLLWHTKTVCFGNLSFEESSWIYKSSPPLSHVSHLPPLWMVSGEDSDWMRELKSKYDVEIFGEHFTVRPRCA